MWLLSCEGNLFNGKRLWLRPGSTHLLGRTTGQAENGERIQHIDHKSVSRKHLLIAVAPTQAEDVSRLHVKSQLSLKDGSKIGTTINGDKIKQEERILGGSGERETQFTIKLGSYEHLFHLEWRPVVLSLTSLGKKAPEEALSTQQERFRQTDVKIVAEYVSNTTTHCVAKKRNTVPTLQALLQAKWLVTESYIDALHLALQRSGPNDESALETDFDGHWPKEDDFIIPPGREPQPRPNEYLKPNAERAEVFHNFVLIFLSRSQYEDLLPVITSGGGKALLHEVDVETSKVEDVVQHVQQVAGHKHNGKREPSQRNEKGGVVVVRMNDSDQASREFMQNIKIALNQRSIEQNELLDPILTLDTSGLQRQLPEASQVSVTNGDAHRQSQIAEQTQHGDRETERSRIHSQAGDQSQRSMSDQTRFQQVQSQLQAAAAASSSPADDNEAPERSQPSPPENTAAKKRSRRLITQSRFKGFDDFDPSQFSKPASQSPEPASQAGSILDMDVDGLSQAARVQQSSRKRLGSPFEAEDEEDMYAGILTAHNVFKKRKLAEAQNVDPSTVQTEADRKLAEKAAKAKKKAKEMDVMAEIQARRKREEDEYRKNEEALREALDGVDIKDLKHLAKIEEMEVPVRERPARHSDGRSDRWDPAWNGRKNFKKFRPQGQRNAGGPRLPRVIVALEEVPRKGHGLGEEYWLNSAATSRSKSKSQSQSQTQSTRRSQQATGSTVEDGETESARFRQRLQTSHQEDEYNAGAEEILPEEIAGHARDERLEAAAHANANAASAVDSTPSQTFGTDSQKRAAGKRPAAEQASGPSAKKARQSQRAASTRESVRIEDDDDDDGLKFRRRRR